MCSIYGKAQATDKAMACCAQAPAAAAAARGEVAAATIMVAATVGVADGGTAPGTLQGQGAGPEGAGRGEAALAAVAHSTRLPDSSFVLGREGN